MIMAVVTHKRHDDLLRSAPVITRLATLDTATSLARTRPHLGCTDGPGHPRRVSSWLMRPARCSPSFACKEREEEGCGGRGRLPIGDEHRHGRHPLAKRRQREKARICTAPRWPVGRTWGPCPPFFFFSFQAYFWSRSPSYAWAEKENSHVFAFTSVSVVGGTDVQCSAADGCARCGCRPAADRTCFPPGSFVLSFAWQRVRAWDSRCHGVTRKLVRAGGRQTVSLTILRALLNSSDSVHFFSSRAIMRMRTMTRMLAMQRDGRTWQRTRYIIENLDGGTMQIAICCSIVQRMITLA